MPFSVYYSSSRRSDRSRRFRVTVDSGERNLSLEERGSDLGGGAGGVWRRERAGGRKREVRRSGAEVTRVVTRELTREVGSGGHESGDEGAHEGARKRRSREW